MEIFSRFKKLIACAILVAFIPSQAWAQGISIPAGSSLNITTGQLTVPGNITNAGTLSATTGVINLNGNWANSGTFSSGTSTVNFTAGSGTQTINSGGAANTDAFYNLTHSTAGTLQLISNPVLINDNFTNTSGAFNANSLNMTVDGAWDNTATFTPGTDTVTLGGTSQSVLGSTNFYSFAKTVSTAATLTFDHTGAQTFSNSLTMQGASSQLLSIRSNLNGTAASIALSPTAAQFIGFVDVQDSNAGTSPAQQTLVARSSPDHSNFAIYNNTNWQFGNTTITWTGTTNTDWNTPTNWTPALVPAAGDTVIVPSGPTNQPVFSTDVIVGSLTIQAGASVNINGHNITVSSTFANSGTLELHGNETTVSLTQDTTNTGTFEYLGDGTSSPITVVDFGATDYYHLLINDTNPTKNTFVTAPGHNLTTAGNVTVTSGALDISANSDTLTVNGILSVNGANGILTATNGNIAANGAVSITAGTFTAPTTAKTFTVTGNFTHTGGTFTNSNGLVTLNGGDQTISGSSTFYQFNKTVGAAHTLTFDHTGTQTFTNMLTMQGASGQVLSIRSDLNGTQANIALSVGGTQVLNFLDVQDSNASGGVLLAPNSSHDSGNNTNWIFGGTTVTWKGSTSTDWNTASNWDLGFIPRASDTVVIANAANQPLLASAVTVTNLTINTGSSLTLSGFALTVSNIFTNKGNLILEGTETLTLTQDTSASDGGTFTYTGDGSGNPITIKDFGANDYYNLTINDAHVGGSAPNLVDTYTIAAQALHVLGTLTVTKSSLTLAAGTAQVDGGVAIASGATLTAPSATTNTAFTVGGNWSNSGTFTNSGGKVTFNGANQSISGNNTFAYLRKVVASADTFTLDHNSTQTVSIDLTMTGAANPNRLSLVSDSAGHQANLFLLAGGTQTISDLSVKDSNAGVVPTDVTLVDRDDFQNAGNNTNWQFGAATLTWTGTTSTNWSVASNWNSGVVPIPGDSVIIPSAPSNQPALTTGVSVGQLNINSGASLTLAGNNLTVTAGAGNFVNNGNLILQGTETVSLTQDTNVSDTGTFTYVGNGTNAVLPIISFGAPDYYNLVINGTNNFTTTTNITTTNNVTITAGTLDISTHSNTLTVGGTLALGGASGATLTATNGNITAASVSIASGDTLTAPAAGSFNVSGNFTNNAGNFVPVTHVTGFNNSSGTVTFTTTGTSTITGNTVFYNFTSTVPGKTIQITAGSTQTVSHTFNLQGAKGNLLNFLSTGAPWNLSLSTTQTVSGINVEGSDASMSVFCLDCLDSGSNTNWIFESLTITSPAPTGTTVGQAPTLLGTAPLNSTVYIRDISGNLVATTKPDANSHFRVVIGHDDAQTNLAITAQLATGANSLTPYLTPVIINPGDGSTIQVSSSTTPAQVPVVTRLNGNAVTNPSAVQFINGSTPTIAGQGAVGQAVTAQALDASGNLIETASLGTVAGDGTYSVTWPSATPLPSATNYLSVTVGGPGNQTTSFLIQVSLTDPFGFIYNSSSNQPIQGAVITLYNATTKQPATGVQSCNAAGTCCDMSGNCCTSGVCTAGNPPGNPFTTLADGFYSFLAPPGQYYINVSAGGYTYPSVQVTPPAGRSVVTGSKGEAFTVGNQVFELDQPLDGNSLLLHITKTANKSEASVGDIVMYTVNIQNLSSTNPVNDVLLSDTIPPGFKYINDRVLLGGSPIKEPTGPRPLVFNVGNVGVGSTEVLQYQLVIGSGVTMGNYKNTAQAVQVSDIVYASIAAGTFKGTGADLGRAALVVSNPAQASVRIIPDPVFDLATVIGKVFFDWNENGVQDAPYYDSVSHETIVEKPVPNVQIVMEDGTIITTDRNGQFSIPGLLPGRHLFRLDERTLPPGAYMTTDKGVIVNLTAGSLSKVNFGVNIDESQIKGRDAVFFNEKLRLTEDRNRPVPRLNAALFDASANARPDTEEVLLNEGALVRQAEFRIFTNYSPFIGRWRLDIMDADTKKVLRSFEGTPLNISDPVYWNGRDSQDVIINGDHHYSYILTVTDNKGNSDSTKEKVLTIREIKDEDGLKKEREETKDMLKDRADRYRRWLDAQDAINNVDHQIIPVQGETIHLDRQGTDVKSIRVMKGDQLFTDIPLTQRYGLTPEELMAGGFSMSDEKDNLEIILPNGDYTMDVVSTKAPDDASLQRAPAEVPQSVPSSGGMPSRTIQTSPGMLEHYSRPLKVGDDYMMFVALGDAQVGYNIDRGNIEPIQDATQQPGFYHEGKAAYYLKGQVLGKYLITSSYDSDRAQKALFRQLDPNTYYPVYGDNSSINYDAADTQGALYLKVEWDKSSAILGNYAVDFNDTEFAAFSQKYYGGKIDYQSVASNPYGDARTKLVVYHAQVQQQPSHNEFLATGGSLYFLKYRNVVQGSDTVTIQVRDQTTGLVIASKTMVNGADYELDNSQGRILFWQPVSMIAQSESIISNNLINGNPIYVVVDYQFEVSGMQVQGSQGARVAQSVGDNLVVGGTYIQNNASGQNYTLAGTDATLHVNKDATIKAEYAQTTSQEQGSYVSTDGGITFSSLNINDSSVSGKAYGIKGDARLFDNIGLKSYYKWIGSDFGASTASSQQGKEMMGLSMTWDMTPVTRLTASEDIQRLLAGGNLQSSAQVGASETDTTMVQIVHTAERLKLTGQFQLTEVKTVVNGIESTTNQRGATMAGQAQYDLTNRIKLTLGQQVDVENPSNTATTMGVAARVTDRTTLNAQEVFSSQGRALTAGVTNQLNNKMAMTTAYTLTNLNTGEVDKTASVGLENKVNNNITTTGNVAMTSSSTGTTSTTASVGAKAKLSESTSLDMSLGKSQNSIGAQSTSVSLNGTAQVDQNTTITATTQASNGSTVSDALGIGTTGVTTTSVGITATRKVDDMTSTNASVNMADDTTNGRTTTVGFGNTSKLDQELQAVTSNSFSFSPASGTADNSKYGIVRNHNGRNLEADFTKQSANQSGNLSQSNIFGLTGDVNDKLALNGSIERGRVQNLDTSRTDRTDFTLGAGYVLKDTETAVERLKNSLKLELRLDRGTGTDSLHQYVLFDAVEGRITDNWSANAKLDYSKTVDVTTGATAERHQEIILGMAYRPVNFDQLNLIGEYSYQDGYGGGTQQADALNTNVQQTVAQVFSAEGIYDINDQWQLAEKLAYRIENEQDTGFAFTQTHTWLVIHRLNYKVDRNWTISAEYRDLAQVEAKDYKQGVLLEATREINQNTELAIGWNFTNYTDDLTNLSYSAQGPYVRMTGKFYDETPEEKARARAKWLDAKINDWAWMLIKKELSNKDSKIVLELNRMFALAQKAQAAGRLEESKQIYKDIIAAGQMMYDEASEYIRSRIAFEEQMKQLDKTAGEYFKGGEYVKARKIWEKVVEDASKGMVK